MSPADTRIARSRAFGPLAPSTVHANKLIGRKVAERLHTIFMHNDPDVFLDYAATEIARHLDAYWVISTRTKLASRRPKHVVRTSAATN
jgi:hypothetical protein